jgi:hypothetical protein
VRGRHGPPGLPYHAVETGREVPMVAGRPVPGTFWCPAKKRQHCCKNWAGDVVKVVIEHPTQRDATRFAMGRLPSPDFFGPPVEGV